uniref:F-box domain-containing protein n=1 Tax=Heterorhabditis bacteriophora TaxID=37862 RepID=A0A1I7X2P5_HETBA
MLAKNQISRCCRRKEMKANSSMLVLYCLQDFSLLFKERLIKLITSLPELNIKEYPEIVNLQTSYADIREVKTVSKQLKRLIERNWRRAFFVFLRRSKLNPKRGKTHMNAADMRRMKLVSKDMRYLIERGGRHLIQQDMRSCIIKEVSRTLCTSNIEPTFKGILLKLQVEPTVYKVTSVNFTHGLNVSLEDFSRIFARIYIFFYNFETRYGSSLVIKKRNGFRYKKEFFQLSTIRKVCHCLILFPQLLHRLSMGCGVCGTLEGKIWNCISKIIVSLIISLFVTVFTTFVFVVPSCLAASVVGILCSMAFRKVRYFLIFNFVFVDVIYSLLTVCPIRSIRRCFVAVSVMHIPSSKGALVMCAILFLCFFAEFLSINSDYYYFSQALVVK